MKGKESFKMRRDSETNEFIVEFLYNGNKVEEEHFKFITDAFEYIADEMGMSQIAGENWEFTYETNE